MGQPAKDEKRYFLGIGGEQAGPFSEDEIWQKIRAQEIPNTTPIWYEGLPEWQPLMQVSPFNQDPPAAAAPAAVKPSISVRAPKKKSAEDGEEEDGPTFAEGETGPVFNPKQGTFSRRSIIEKFGKQMVIGLVVALFGAAGYYVFVSGGEILEQVQNATQPKKPPPLAETRETKARKALSELLLSPQSSTEVLRTAWREKPDDEVGKDSFNALLDFYSSRAPQEAGRLLMEAKRPDEAVKFFLVDPPNYVEAAQAYAAASAAATDAEKKKTFALEEIAILIGPGNSREQALKRLQEFEKTHPGSNHPFRYYLKTPDQKIQDIFERISFYFVQSLMALLETEFKQMKLTARPRVEIRREPDGKYRIAAHYSGDVLLSRDKLPGIKLQFWMVKEQWLMVETNLTEERQKWARGEKAKYSSATLTSTDMLAYLETIFHTQFPRYGLHEKPSEARRSTPE